MKIRITENKIRVRLKEPEVVRLYEGMPIMETLEFGGQPDQQLKFRLETYDQPNLGIPANSVLDFDIQLYDVTN